MKKIRLMLACLCCSVSVMAQHTITIQVQEKESGHPLQGANVTLTPGNITRSADTSGIVRFEKLEDGIYQLQASFTDRETYNFSVTVKGQDISLSIFLSMIDEEEEEVVIRSTRSSRTISNIPTRVEFIAGEELDEKSNMKPGDIRMVLSESTGIQTQQTSVTSANASIRIQGLDGRYTQVLKDGFPAYAGLGSGLGLLQTPPLDLMQFEVIKGSTSTLYGGGAIAGLVNLISKIPGKERELRFHFDVTSSGGLNTSAFFGQQFGKTGTTIFFSRNSNAAYDPASIGLTAIPKFSRYTINPKFFFRDNRKISVTTGFSFTTENRIGGDIEFIRGEKSTGFFERNKSHRLQSQLSLNYQLSPAQQLNIKSSFNYFRRAISEQDYRFLGSQKNYFTEINYMVSGKVIEWVTGLNYITDNFRENVFGNWPPRNESQRTLGFFLQQTWKQSDIFRLETGLRTDHVNRLGWFVLPRIAALLKFNEQISSRIGGGLGYKTPSIFNEEAERLQYRNIRPVDLSTDKPERSYGVNADVNWKKPFASGRGQVNFNHLFFYTRIQDPFLLVNEGSFYVFKNADGHFDSRGMETNLRVKYKPFVFFVGYTFTNAQLHEANGFKQNYLTPKHRLNNVVMFEVEEKLKLGLEAYYFSSQLLSDGSTGQPYWITGFMAEKLWEKWSVYINFENFLDTRQTRFEKIYTGDISSPVFRDIYAPLDGRVINGGVKLKI